MKIINKGKIDAGKNSYAIYGKNVQLTSGSELKVGDNGVGIFSTSTTPATPNIVLRRIFGEDGLSAGRASSNVVTSDTLVTALIFAAATTRNSLAN